VAGTAVKLLLTTDHDTITDDGKSDCQLIVQVQDASGTRITSQPSITLTDQNGLGAFPTGTAITFASGAIDDGVIEGLASIEYRSYNPGTATITATSTGLTSSSVTITVLHVNDSIGTVGVLHPAARLPMVMPASAVIKTTGGSIRLPAALQGKKVAISVFDLNGVEIDSRVVARSPASLRIAAPDKAQKTYIVKIRTLE
jgi:hypothetical protein